MTGCKQIQDAAQNAARENNSRTTSESAASAAAQSDRDLDPLLANPRVGDLYAAEVTYFSGVSFNENGAVKNPMESAYGLMKVVDVAPDKVVVITETSAWPNAQGARNDLRGDLEDITWDENEKITILRDELAKHYADGKIIEARRFD
ncbi:MAG: hypothetical protein LBL59_02130 [Xanthomonadaceae bacterium]|nr:hypothetical protein [Xanthomonadaceae bacterium]